MNTMLNVKVGDWLTFRTAAGEEFDAEVVEFPKIIRVKTADGALQDIRPEDVLTEQPKRNLSTGRFRGRLQARL